MAEEKACDRDRDHNNRTEGKYRIVCERRALAGSLCSDQLSPLLSRLSTTSKPLRFGATSAKATSPFPALHLRHPGRPASPDQSPRPPCR